MAHDTTKLAHWQAHFAVWQAVRINVVVASVMQLGWCRACEAQRSPRWQSVVHSNEKLIYRYRPGGWRTGLETARTIARLLVRPVSAQPSCASSAAAHGVALLIDIVVSLHLFH